MFARGRKPRYIWPPCRNGGKNSLGPGSRLCFGRDGTHPSIDGDDQNLPHVLPLPSARAFRWPRAPHIARAAAGASICTGPDFSSGFGPHFSSPSCPSELPLCGQFSASGKLIIFRKNLGISWSFFHNSSILIFVLIIADCPRACL